MEQASLTSHEHLNEKETPRQYKSELKEAPGPCPTPGSLQAFPDHPQFPLLPAPPLNHEFPTGSSILSPLHSNKHYSFR